MKNCIVLPGNQLGSGKYVKVPQMNIHWLLGLMSKGISAGEMVYESGFRESSHLKFENDQ